MLIGRRLSRSTETPASSVTAHSRSASPVGRRPLRSAGSRSAASATARSAGDGARPSACQNTRSTASPRVVQQRRRAAAACRARRQQPVHVRLGVEDEEADLRIQRGADVAARVLEPDRAAEPREAAAGDVVDQHATGSSRGRPAARVGTVIGPRPAAGRAVDRRQRRQRHRRRRARRAPLAPRPAARAPARSSRSSCTTSHSLRRAEMSMSNALERRRRGRRRRVVEAHRLGRQLAEHPPRAARQPAASASRRSPAPAPAASSPARRATEMTWSRIGRPSARVRSVDAHAPFAPVDAGTVGRRRRRSGGRGASPPARRGRRGRIDVFHSPVIAPIASANCSAVRRRTSGPANT